MDEWIPNTAEQQEIKDGRCSLGRLEYGGDRYCYTHGGFQYGRGPCSKNRTTGALGALDAPEGAEKSQELTTTDDR